ncbi:MAG TPA: hypothetical protein VFT22_43130 [Kofleriaceae bacterium]|nr:hypothetical protein [Kofleriaceae bacterium]
MVRGALAALVLALVPAALLAGIAGAPRRAAADPNDLVLSRLATRITGAGGQLDSVVGQNLEFRALASQLGVVLAPHLLTPADTLGFGGFQFDVDVSQTSIDSTQPYWRARAGSPDPSGENRVANGPSVLRTVGVFAHKGLWFPVPSFEIGVGAVHLIDSSTWTAQLYGKIGLQEGYHELPIPSLAVRGAVSRMMNQRELDLTVASLDITASKHFGIGGTWRLDPFIGWNLLFIIPRSEVIDATPNVDPLNPGDEMDANNNFVFKDQSTIYRQRLLVGAKFQYYVVQLTVEAQLALAGSSVDDRAGTSDPCQPGSTTSNCDAKDIAAAQTTLSVSAGVDF